MAGSQRDGATGRRGRRIVPRREVDRGWWAYVAAGAVLVATAVAALALWQLPESGREERERERLAAASAIADARRGWFTELQRQLDQVAAVIGSEARDGRLPDDVVSDARLAQLAAAATLADDGVFVVDASSRVVATLPRKRGLLRLQRPQDPVPGALAGRPTASGVTEDPLERVPLVRLAVPVRVGDRVVGAVVGGSRADVGTVRAALAPGVPLPELRAELVTPDDRTLTSGAGTVPASLDVRDPARRARTGQGITSYAGEGGVERTAGAVVVHGGWVVVVHGESAVLERAGSRPLGAVAGLVLVAATALAAIAVARGRVARVKRQSDAAQRAMLSVTGHELRTPLTVILGQSRTLSRRWGVMDEAQRRELIAGIGHQARTLDRLVERLLHAAQLAARVGRGLPLRAVDVTAVAGEVVEAAAALAPLHDLTLHGGPATALGDAGALRQVLGHLVDNAVRYSPDGGPVEVVVGRRGKHVEVVVADQGVGLPADSSRIFDGFVQGEEVDVRVHDEGGVGLGLTIVRDLLTQLGGSVRAEDNAPRGARFVVELPAMPAAD